MASREDRSAPPATRGRLAGARLAYLVAAAGLAISPPLRAFGQAPHLKVVTQPDTAKAGALLKPQPQVQLTDTSGKELHQAGVRILVSLRNDKDEVLDDNNGCLIGTFVAVTNSSGLASFTNLVIAGRTGSRHLKFSSSTRNSVRSSDILVTAGDRYQLKIVRNPSSSVQDGVIFDSQPEIQIVDRWGNPVRNDGIVVHVTIPTNSEDLLGHRDATTRNDGRADFADLALHGRLGPRLLEFTSAGVISVSREVSLVEGGDTDPNFHLLTGVEYSSTQQNFSTADFAAAAQYVIPLRRSRSTWADLTTMVERTSAIEVVTHRSCELDTVALRSPVGDPVKRLYSECGRGSFIDSMPIDSSFRQDRFELALPRPAGKSYTAGPSWRWLVAFRYLRRIAKAGVYLGPVVTMGINTYPNAVADLGSFAEFGSALAVVDSSGFERFSIEATVAPWAQDFANVTSTSVLGNSGVDSTLSTQFTPSRQAFGKRKHVRLFLAPRKNLLIRGYLQIGDGPDLAQLALILRVPIDALVGLATGRT